MNIESLSQSGEPDFKLGEWWVRPQRNVLERGEEAAHVEARSMGVLVCLARRAPEVVSKERLLKEVWSDAPFVGEEVLSHAIWELRKALGDSAREPRYVQTIARKGYRLVAEVVRAKGSPVPISGVQINHYDLGEELGRGAMGVVFEAVDRRLDRPVAIKFLAPELTRDPAALQRFEREARLAASLDHPNLATVLEIGETKEGHRYLVTPLYRGGSLKERLMRGPIPVEEAVRLARQLAAGLGAAHRREIVHRDVKPANLLLDDHGTLKIADFGIAKLLGATDLTRTGATLGTPAYKSPEQSRGEPVDHRSDLWSLGVVLFEMLTGRRPFDGEYEQAVVHAIVAGEPRSLEGADGRPIPEGLRRIVAKAMAKQPAERYQSAEEIVRDLDSLGASEVTPRWTRRTQRNWGMAGVGAALAAMILGWIVFQSRGYVPPRDAVDHLQQAQSFWLRGNDPVNMEGAEAHFAEAVYSAPTWAEALALFAVFKIDRFARIKHQDDLDQAHELLEKARLANPKESLILVAKARLLLLAPDYPEAERVAREAVALNPTCAQGKSCDLAYIWLGEALWQQEKHKEATAFLERGAEEGDGRIRCPLKLAQLLERAGEAEKAILLYEEVLGWETGQTTALSDLGRLYAMNNQHEKAASTFRELYFRTKDPNAALNLGHTLYEQKRWEEAISYYEQADELYKGRGQILPTPAVTIGDVYLEQGRAEEAKPWYEKALSMFEELKKGESFSLTHRAQQAVCLAKLGRFGEAKEAIEQLLEASQQFPEVFCYVARIYALEKNREKLFDLARQAIEAGNPPLRLRDDAAFIAYRGDQEYRQILEPLLMPGR